LADELTFETLSANGVRNNLDALIAVAADIPGEYWAAENFLVEPPNKWRLSFSVWHKQKLIRYAILSQRAPRHIHLHHFMIVRSERSKGHGQQMVWEIISRCQTFNAKKLMLKTPEDNDGAIRFYKRYGFEVTDVESGHTVMTRTL